MTAVTLALDIGTNMGFAILCADGKIESGAESFPLVKGHEGRRFIGFRAWLIDVKSRHEPRRVVYERVVHVGESQAYASQLYGGFLAIVLMFCEHHQIEHEGFNLATVKKAWTGSGNADKEKMIARCRALGFDPRTSDEADAIAVLHVGLDRCPPIPIADLAARFKRKPRPNPDHRTAPMQLAPSMPDKPF